MDGDGLPGTAPSRLLYLQGRNLGDAVIGTGIVEALGRSFPQARLTVLTRPAFVDIYRHNPHVAELRVAAFPMGTEKGFGAGAAVRLLAEVTRLRHQRFDRVIHLAGDVRENLLGWLIAPWGNVGVRWAEGHPYRRLVRSGLDSLLTQAVTIPADDVSVYAAIDRLTAGLGATAAARPYLYGSDGRPCRHQPGGDAIGLHPLASQPCRLWPVEQWRELIRLLRSRGLRVVVFGPPGAHDQLAAHLPGRADPGIEIAAAPLTDFFEALGRVRALVCLDSFAVHAAAAVGTPRLMINGANMAALWAPPGTEIIDGGRALACAPCYNRPGCTRSDSPFRCIRDTIPEQVIAGLDRLGALAT